MADIVPRPIDLSAPISMAWHRRAANEPAQRAIEPIECEICAIVGVELAEP
jgi:hypothetical protein